jgi:hypothetical protein
MAMCEAIFFPSGMQMKFFLWRHAPSLQISLCAYGFRKMQSCYHTIIIFCFLVVWLSFFGDFCLPLLGFWLDHTVLWKSLSSLCRLWFGLFALYRSDLNLFLHPSSSALCDWLFAHNNFHLLDSGPSFWMLLMYCNRLQILMEHL